MKKIKVYDIDGFMRKDTGKQAFDMRKAMILVGDKGVLLFDYEGVGYKENIITDSIKIGLNDIPEEKEGRRSVYILPQYEATIQIKEIIDNADFEEMYLTEFMTKHNYNSRCQNNFSIVLDSITEIGLNISDYYISE